MVEAKGQEEFQLPFFMNLDTGSLISGCSESLLGWSWTAALREM